MDKGCRMDSELQCFVVHELVALFERAHYLAYAPSGYFVVFCGLAVNMPTVTSAAGSGLGSTSSSGDWRKVPRVLLDR